MGHWHTGTFPALFLLHALLAASYFYLCVLLIILIFVSKIVIIKIVKGWGGGVLGSAPATD